MLSLMCGAGLRLMECLRLRVQEVDFGRSEILVRDGKGAKDRITTLPESLKARSKSSQTGIRPVLRLDRSATTRWRNRTWLLGQAPARQAPRTIPGAYQWRRLRA